MSMAVKSQDGSITMDFFIAIFIFPILLVDSVWSNEVIILFYADQYTKHSDW